MSEMRKLSDQLRQMRDEGIEGEAGGYVDGYWSAGRDAIELALAHEAAQREAVDELAVTFVGRAKEIEDARFELSRGVLGLIQPRPEQTLAEIVAEVVKFKATDCRECEAHVCECDCDEDELSWAQREDIRGVINTLKGML